MIPPDRFAPASRTEKIVFGAQRPGYPSERVRAAAVRSWLTRMQTASVARVCCLLHPGQLTYFEPDLLAEYGTAFGPANVLHVPIPDYHLCNRADLVQRILPFLFESEAGRDRVVVHCSGGLGRTGHVLAAWLCAGRGFEPDEAIREVERMHRDPLEAVRAGTASREELLQLLASGRDQASCLR